MLPSHLSIKNKVVNNSLFTALLTATFLISVVKAEEVSRSKISTDYAVSQYMDNISEIEMTRGPHDTAIEENLISLSMIYKDQGDHIKRLDVLNQALHLHRLNYGKPKGQRTLNPNDNPKRSWC